MLKFNHFICTISILLKIALLRKKYSTDRGIIFYWLTFVPFFVVKQNADIEWS